MVMKSNSRKRTAISLFAGAGGMDVGFSNAGFKILIANDNDPDACSTYRLNHSAPIHCGTVETFIKQLPKDAGVDLVFGGPPCQGFSVAGKMDPADPRNTLTQIFLRAVNRVRPRAFVCENVKALATLAKWGPLRSKLIKQAEKMGYKCALIILNSSDYGVPQSRERMFFIGFLNEYHRLNNITVDSALINLVENFKERPPPLRQVLRQFGRPGELRNRRVCNAKVTFAKRPVMRRSPYAGMLFNGKGRPLRADGFSSTLPASMGGNKTPIVDEENIYGEKPSWVEEYHQHLMEGGKPYKGVAPSRLRRLTIDECLAIQAFPKGYQLFGKQSSMYRQIGNAVPSILAEAVARTVMAVLDSNLVVLEEAAKRVHEQPEVSLPTTSMNESPYAEANLI